MSTDGDFRRELEQLREARLNRFRILVCIDGSDECYRGLRYAAMMGGGRDDCDIILLYIRPLDQGLHSGGLQVRMARENMLNWGLELPGIRYLKKGLEVLLGDRALTDEWDAETTHTARGGDPLGDNKVEYRHASGRTIVLKLKSAPDPASGILDQYELGPYDVIIVGSGGHGRGRIAATLNPSISERVALHAPCSVLVARHLEAGHGHLVCVDDSAASIEMARHEAVIAKRFETPKLCLLSVAADAAGLAQAETIVETVRRELADFDFEFCETMTRIGDPVEKIVEAGRDFSLIVIGDTSKGMVQRLVFGGVSSEIMRRSDNAVMVIR